MVSDLKLDDRHNNRIHEETNVKRRVYDALNVLIAARVINRDGRIISNIKNNRQNDVVDKSEEMRVLLQKIAIK